MEVQLCYVLILYTNENVRICERIRCKSINLSINQSKFISCPFKIPTQRRSRPRPSGKEQSLEAGGIENRQHFGGALDLFQVHSWLFDQPQKINVSAMSQSG